MNWKSIIGSNWFDLMEDFVESDKMYQIIKMVSLERKKYTVYPNVNEFGKMFRIFKDLPPEDIKVIILGLDPYPNGCGSGYSFCNNGNLKISPSLSNIFKELATNDTEKEDLVIDPLNLERWVRQGVFLANVYLTVREGNPGLHTFWNPFTIEWITQLNTFNDIVWLMWGRKAQEYEKYVTNSSHSIIRTSHPSPLGATKDSEESPAFIGSKCFEKVNNELWVNNKELIRW